uniref:Diguanylate cyclase/phosphodiesterase n=1 Tax=Cereibacter sphaeroides (strain ATCC 17025 / ATH 2.4.3) TaxID=349102 RepID=A4X020_CERS5
MTREHGWRLARFACLVFALTAFWYGPALFGLSVESARIWFATAHLVGPLLAAALCVLAALRSEGGDRVVWFSFAAGSALYTGANALFVTNTLTGQAVAFPSLAEAAFFAMGGCFAFGMSKYSSRSLRITSVQIYNFLLIYCALFIACLFLLHFDIKHSVLGPAQTAVAYLYPALWFSVLAFGILSLIFFDHGKRSFPLFLLVIGIAAEAVADFWYVRAIMNGTYTPGGMTLLLWLSTTGLVALAAAEHLALIRRAGLTQSALRRRTDAGIAQAALPGIVIAIFMLSGSLSGAFGRNWEYVAFSSVLGLIFAAVAALREYAVIRSHEALRTEAEESREEVSLSRRRLAAVLESTSDAVVVFDRSMRVEYFNENAVSALEGVGAPGLGASFTEIFPETSFPGALVRFRSAQSRQEPMEYDALLSGPDRWLSINGYPSNGGLSIFFRDVTEQRTARERMAHLAHHDPMTGLANRMKFSEELQRCVSLETPVSVLLIDLDNFKDMNDTLGHPLGDAVLVEIGRRLQQLMRPGNLAARLGGDEFAMLIFGQQDRIALGAIAERVLARISAPIALPNQTVRVTASMGIAMDDVANRAELVRTADIALYEAKRDNRGTYRFFDGAMEIRLRERTAIIADLTAALGNNEFVVHYQPLYELASHRICGFEALLRWTHPVRGLVSPEVFIPIAEDTGLIHQIGAWVLRTACTAAADWPADVRIAVNLSPRQFRDLGLPTMVARVLEETGLRPNRLELEVTEAALLDDSGSNLDIFAQLNRMGIRIALDDFGTGYSALSYLQKFPFAKLKIDRSFITGLPDSESSMAIVSAICSMAHALSIRVTAEGVETRDQFDWLQTRCNEIQGYLISRPVPAGRIPDLLAGKR